MPRRDLSAREMQVVEGLVAGMTHKAIGAELGISHKTVNAHAANIRRILRAKDRAEVVAWYNSLKRDPPHCATCTCGQHAKAVTMSQPEGSPVAY
jgi:DNA-binding CsgD family transcriptional regulator